MTQAVVETEQPRFISYSQIVRNLAHNLKGADNEILHVANQQLFHGTEVPSYVKEYPSSIYISDERKADIVLHPLYIFDAPYGSYVEFLSKMFEAAGQQQFRKNHVGLSTQIRWLSFDDFRMQTEVLPHMVNLNATIISRQFDASVPFYRNVHHWPYRIQSQRHRANIKYEEDELTLVTQGKFKDHTQAIADELQMKTGIENNYKRYRSPFLSRRNTKNSQVMADIIAAAKHFANANIGIQTETPFMDKNNAAILARKEINELGGIFVKYANNTIDADKLAELKTESLTRLTSAILGVPVPMELYKQNPIEMRAFLDAQGYVSEESMPQTTEQMVLDWCQQVLERSDEAIEGYRRLYVDPPLDIQCSSRLESDAANPAVYELPPGSYPTFLSIYDRKRSHNSIKIEDYLSLGYQLSIETRLNKPTVLSLQEKAIDMLDIKYRV